MKSSTICKEDEKSSLFTTFCYPMTALFDSYGLIKYEHLLAGIAGGVVSTTILHPLDTIRTRLAVTGSPLISAGIRRPSYSGLVDVLTTITRSHGVHGVYRGVTLGVVAAGCTWGSYFFFYEAFKAQMRRDDPTKRLGPGNYMIAATESGLITLVLTNPIYVIKTRLCLQFGAQDFSEEKRYRGIMDALVKTYRNEGIKGFYKGLLPGFFGVSHTAIQLMMYEEMKSYYKERHNMSSDSRMSTMTYLSFTALSKLIAVIATYPYRLMRTRMQDQHHEHNGAIDILIRTWRYEGIRGFYKGMLPTLLRVTPATAITFVVYENISQNLIQNSAVASKSRIAIGN